MDLNLLNEANALRLPQFKNKHGEMAHSHPKGADWSPRMWLVALMGEVGELVDANELRDPQQIADEAADVQTYLDIYCQRAVDGYNVDDKSTIEYGLLRLIHSVGKLCENHKKYVRGDTPEMTYTKQQTHIIHCIHQEIDQLQPLSFDAHHTPNPGSGINLADATMRKFNRVSERVGSDVFLTPSRIVRRNLGEIE